MFHFNLILLILLMYHFFAHYVLRLTLFKYKACCIRPTYHSYLVQRLSVNLKNWPHHSKVFPTVLSESGNLLFLNICLVAKKVSVFPVSFITLAINWFSTEIHVEYIKHQKNSCKGNTKKHKSSFVSTVARKNSKKQENP